MNLLLDTCVVSEFTRKRPNRGVMRFVQECDPLSLFLSSMTVAELHRGVRRLDDGKRKNSLLTWLSELEHEFDSRILPFDLACAIQWARVYAAAEERGRKLSAFDSIIAAVCAGNNLTLVTRNVSDFEHSGVEIIDPWDRAHGP